MSNPNPKVEVFSGAAGALALALGSAAPAKAPEKPAEPTMPAGDATAAPAGTTPPGDDDEDEIGLTAAERAALSGTSRDELPQAVKKAIGKKHRQAKEWEERAISRHAEAMAEKQRAEAAERRVAELEAKSAPAKPAAAPADEDPKPVWKEGMDTAEYWDARDAWVRRQAIRDFQAEQVKRTAEEARQAAGREAEARIVAAKALVPDFAQVTGGADLHFGDDVSEAIWQSHRFAEIAYHLAKDPERAAAIRKMSIGKALLAIGNLEATLAPFAPSAKAAASTPPAPSAPPASASPTATAPSKTPEIPIMTPIPTGGSDSQVMRGSTSESIARYEQSTGRNLSKRRRH